MFDILLHALLNRTICIYDIPINDTSFGLSVLAI